MGAILLCWAAVLLGVGLCVAMEFSVDGKILEWLPVWGGYGVMALSCIVIGTAAYQVIFKSLGVKADG